MKIICIGRNYADHAAEMKSEVPEQPVVFMKPPSALLVNGKPFYYPDFTENLHHELELVLKISKNGRHVQPEHAPSYYSEVALGLDLTARDLQTMCKEKGQPWEIAKGFDGSAVLGDFVPVDRVNRSGIAFELKKNGETVQRGNSKDLIFSFEEIIVYVSRFFKLQMGDLIYTGTPAGVGPLQIGDVLEGYLHLKDEVNRNLKCEVR